VHAELQQYLVIVGKQVIKSCLTPARIPNQMAVVVPVGDALDSSSSASGASFADLRPRRCAFGAAIFTFIRSGQIFELHNSPLEAHAASPNSNTTSEFQCSDCCAEVKSVATAGSQLRPSDSLQPQTNRPSSMLHDITSLFMVPSSYPIVRRTSRNSIMN
jgi:hypothetical protein